MSRPVVAPRSCLVVPAVSERMLARASERGADEVVIDLEDAVPAAQKDVARGHALAAIALYDWSCAVSVRVNALGTPWCNDDLAAVAAAAPALGSVVVPKVERAEDLAFAGRLLDGAERAAGRTQPLGVQALIETPRGVLEAPAIATASPRAQALVLGYVDLAAALGRADDSIEDSALWRPLQDAILLAARAAGICAIDGPHVSIDDLGSVQATARAAREAGFDGKWAIHPAHVELLNAAFTPSDREVLHARAVLTALDGARADGKGAARLDGAMVDEAHRAGALAVLARADRAS